MTAAWGSDKIMRLKFGYTVGCQLIPKTSVGESLLQWEVNKHCGVELRWWDNRERRKIM